ncbi:50S ribosomal protein L25/general stress protein Ctc [Amnibacterium setariae]|uniref:Large ribosomal subunit protein bL25 n=1 Tax=Amnibacterium setariae TaxID=2306585 RepID=A0A3A1U371_9MICO|nr:50S ribosomal protein L25/general stress protein Ctc [Amnibacterium setariae]RIX30823.1 50S ribosomal protein L25/general stress protein Ctc [Amnibacterium setariae]
MAEQISAETRTAFGKGAARKLRAAGRIPAVVYGHGTDPVHISLPAHETALIIRRANAVLDLALPTGSQLALVKDVQKDPVRQIIEHLDLILVRTGELVEVEVPVVLEGEAAPGTVANLDSQTLLLKVSATAIPQNLVVNIEGAEDGTQITAADVQLPEGAELAGDPALLIVGVANSQSEQSLEDATAGEDAPAEGDVVASES